MRECTDRKDRRLKRERNRGKNTRDDIEWREKKKERREGIRIERQGRGERKREMKEES